MEANGWSALRRIAGTRNYALNGRLALLEQALLLDTMQQLAAVGFTPLTVPSLAPPAVFIGTGHFPADEEDVFALSVDGLHLAATTEIALTNLHGGEILDERDLRYRNRQGRVHFAHTLNNTAIATPRILAPLLENHQAADGRVRLPAGIRRLLGGEDWL